MASGVLKRTIFYGVHQGTIRFSDWANVVTSQGSCAEPYQANLRNSPGTPINVDFDPADQIVRIDEIEQIDLAKENLLWGGCSGGKVRIRVGP